MGQARTSGPQAGSVGQGGEADLKGKKAVNGLGWNRSPRWAWQEKGPKPRISGMLEVPESSTSGPSLGLGPAQTGATACGPSGGGPAVASDSPKVVAGENIDGAESGSAIDDFGVARGGLPLYGVSQSPSADPGSPLFLAQSQLKPWGEEDIALGYEGVSEELAHGDEGEGMLTLFDPCKYSSEGEEAVGEDPTPLSMVPPSISSDWVLKKVEELQSCMGISCVRYEEQFKALIIAIEADQHGVGSRRDRELKRLMWSINYDGKEGSASRGRNKGRGGIVDK
ncbi:uncharacterized protein LOC121252060 [Juglans microcarpa x Juglans regia]|uniref:uncharacterized protein LOC121252060 n=1 Tax=Juglans microcarpa x Juglans regia TaxID=2249226 RepID=UPI001B7E3EC6|nr:uncharacterized protein LOC121252060 [Juglans microcarpa x Juglans regia]